MPGLVAFGRRWSIGSDDVLIPSFTLFIVHIIWIGVIIAALVVDFGEQENWPGEGCKMHSLGLLSTILVLVLFSTILELSLTVVSLRGSILNDVPRTAVSYLMYIRLSIIWSRNYYLSCDLVLTKQVMIGLIVWISIVLFSTLLTMWCVYDYAGRSWVKMTRYQANVKEQMEHRHPSFRRSGSSGTQRTQRNWRHRKVMRKYESSWDHRCRLLFCCVHKSESSRIVPSDIIVGLLLLRKLQRSEQVSIINEKRNHTYEFLSGIAITPSTRFVAMNNAQDLEVYQNVVYYMRYASAAYGWLWYVIPNGFRGLFNLCSNVKCCFHRYLCNSLGSELSENVVEDNCCFCNVAVIPTMFDPSTFDIVYATYHVDVGETPFFVVVDYEKKAIVVSIRGTLSLKDLMTDFNAEAEPLPLHPIREDWLGHKGMVQVASYLKSKLLEEHIIERAFEVCGTRTNETFNIVVVGHSLGGGAAAILAILLREQFPNLVCYAYSPPGGLLSMPAVEYTKEFVTSVIVGKDLVPRIGLSQMEALRADLLNAIKKSRTPKWKTIMSGMRCCKCVAKTEFSSGELNYSSTGGDNSSVSQKSFQEVDLLSPNDSVLSMTTHQPLYPPGRIMHVVRHHPKKNERIVGKREPVFQAIWTENTDYDEVLISPGMIQDHMPDNVLKALNRVTMSLGPAKPQRAISSSASPMNILHEGGPGGGNIAFLESSSKIHSEASFNSEASAAAAAVAGAGVVPPPPTSAEPPIAVVLHPTPVILTTTSPMCTGMGNGSAPMADEMMEGELDGEYGGGGSLGSTETLFSLKISWDLFKELGKYPIKFKQSHTRNNSSGSSSNCSYSIGTTMNEIFGPLKMYECTVPLASCETLSEISSLSSKASFILRDTRSPMTKIKLGKNLSLRVSEHGRSHSTNGQQQQQQQHYNGKSHQRSLSCIYPEGKKGGTTNNRFGKMEGGEGERNGHSQPEQDNLFIGKGGGVEEDKEREVVGVRQDDFGVDPDRTPTGDPQHLYLEDENGEYYIEVEEFILGGDSIGEEGEYDQEHPSEEDLELLEEEEEEVLEIIGESGSADAAVAVHNETTTTPDYSPVYPTFSSQGEYGEQIHKSPHYNYKTTEQIPNTDSEDSSSSVHPPLPPRVEEERPGVEGGGREEEEEEDEESAIYL